MYLLGMLMDSGQPDLKVLLNNNFDTYFELLELVFKEVDFDYDTFAMPTFGLWIQVSPIAKELFKFEFGNCHITSISALSLDPRSGIRSYRFY